MVNLATATTYTLTKRPSSVIRDIDGMWVFENAGSPDWQAYQAWLAAGNTPNPYVPAPLTKQQEADAWLKGGLTVTSNTKSALNGTYGVTPPDNHNINSLSTAYTMTGSFPNQAQTVTIFDLSGVPHVWDSNFPKFVSAVRDFVHNCHLYAGGQAASLPSNMVEVDAAGVAPMPAFAVFANATQAISKNIPTKILFDTKEFDTTSAFSMANSRFTPKIAGYYEINCGCGVNAGSVKIYASIYKNGAEYRRSTTTGEANARLSTLVHFNGTTDYVEGYVYCTANFSTVTGGILTSFSGALVQKEVVK